jgi:hypothetical protein
MTTAEKYVTAAYLVVLAAVLLYVVLYAFKISRLEREIEALAEDVSRKGRDSAAEPERASVGQ